MRAAGMVTQPWRLTATGNPGAMFLRYFGPVALGAAVIAMPVFLHLASPALAIAVCVVLAILVANFATAMAPVVIIFSYLFQNLFVAFVSPALHTVEELNAIRAYNFLLTAVIWLVLYLGYWIERSHLDPQLRRLIDVTTVALAVIAVYFCLGAASDTMGAIIYLRNIATPFILLQIFALVAYRHRIELLGPLMVMTGASLLYGYTELFFQSDLYRLTNGESYLMIGIRQFYDAGDFLQKMHETGWVMRSYLDTMVVDLFNTPLLADWKITVSRIVGPNFHSISFAYFLAGIAIVLTATGRWWFALLTLPLIFVIGSKGALVLFAVCIIALFLINYVPASRRLWIYVAVLCCYAALAIETGIRLEDYHVIGFIGGLRGFVSNPLGHGIGVGGNLSMNAAKLNWERLQQVGHTDVAVESAVGVLLYQTGIAAFVLLALLLWIGRTLWRLYLVSGTPVFAAVGIGILTIVANGIFQEEALFSPLALGLLAAFAGLLLGSVYRETAVMAPSDVRRMPLRR